MESKYNELEKLNQLKADGTITSAEFEMQKAKMLNDKSKTKKVKKKVFKIIVGVILAVVLVVGCIFGFFFARKSITQNKISNINAEELETLIIEELKNTRIYLNKHKDEYKYNTAFSKNENDFVVANIDVYSTNNSTFMGCVKIPCFKVESDSRGNFKSIKYIGTSDIENVNLEDNEIEKAIKNVLINNYNVDSKYFNKLRNMTDVYCKESWISAETFLEIDAVLYGISSSEEYKEYSNNFDYSKIIYDEHSNTCQLSQGVFTFGIDS